MNKSESKYFNTATKMNLALISLLKEKPLEYITVSEICKAAGVNRSTFYLHYETIGDLLDEAARHLSDNFLAYFTKDKTAAVMQMKGQSLDACIFINNQYLIPYLSFFKDNKEILRTILMHTKTFGFSNVYKQMFDCIFDPILDRFHYSPSIRQYVMMYYLNGVNAVITEWLNNDCDRSIDEMAEIIKICIYGKDNANE